jgi:hypothetical protein
MVGKRQHLTRDRAYDDIAWFLHHRLLPPHNKFPPSLYLHKQLLGCKDIADFERHACPNDCRVRH